MGRLLQGQRRVLRRPRLARWRRKDRQHPHGPPHDRRAAASEPRQLGRHSSDFCGAQLRPQPARLPLGGDGALPCTRRRAPRGSGQPLIGTPVDDTPALVQEALRAAANAPGYPTVHGTPALREAITAWFDRRRGVPGLDPQNVMPTVGSKELVAWLPFLLGLKPGDVVVRPTVAYPTYDIGATFAGAEQVAADDLDGLDAGTRARVRLVWVNSPANPTGSVRDIASLRRIVRQAREIGAVVASDECYAELGWGEWDVQRGGAPVPSILDPRV